jgi:tetrahydromethanopterin S-methyltransferase subunit C
MDMEERNSGQDRLSEEGKRPPHKLGRNVPSLGMVSLFTDLSRQMVYRLIPTFLDLPGTSPAILGLIPAYREKGA